jgi:hypothetical protein
VGSIPDPKPGDWLEHKAIKPRTHLLGTRRRAKRAEVIGVSSCAVAIYLEGEPGLQTITRADITRWWNIFVPQPDPEDIEPPPWVKEGVELHVKNYRAVIRSVRSNWVSFIEECPEFHDVLRMMPYREFVAAGWVGKPSVWEWLRNPLV